jgi:hypothetical protein
VQRCSEFPRRGCGFETRRFEFSDRGTGHSHTLGSVDGAPTISDIEDALEEVEAIGSATGPKARALMEWYRDRIQVTAWHPEARQEEWPPAPDGFPEEGSKEPVNVLRTMLHEVPPDAQSRNEHMGNLCSRCMLHVCSAYCLRKDPVTGKMFCRSGYGPDAAIRGACTCPAHKALSRERSAEDALASADPPWCKTCNPDGPGMPAAELVPPEEEADWYVKPESLFVTVSL